MNKVRNGMAGVESAREHIARLETPGTRLRAEVEAQRIARDVAFFGGASAARAFRDASTRMAVAMAAMDVEADALWSTGIAQRVLILQSLGELPAPPKWDDSVIARAHFPQCTGDSPPAVHPDVLALAAKLAPPDWTPPVRAELSASSKTKRTARLDGWLAGRAQAWRSLAASDPAKFLAELANAEDSGGKGREPSRVAWDHGLNIEELESLRASAKRATAPKRRRK